MPRKSKDENVEIEATPICEKCGNAMIEEDGEWCCPTCQGEIDFLGEDE